MNKTIRTAVFAGLFSAATWITACQSTTSTTVTPHEEATPAATAAPASSASSTTTPSATSSASTPSTATAASTPAASNTTPAPAAPAAPAPKPATATAPTPTAPATAPMPMADKMYVVMETSKGSAIIELDHKMAPASVENFLNYVNAGYYNGTVFHRVIRDFMIQGGGFTTDLTQKPTNAPIKNEGGNGLINSKYTIAMARTNDPNSATSQFFINTVDNPFLNSKSGRPGYAVFGQVIDGKEVVDAIRVVPTTRKPLNTPQGAAPSTDVPVDVVQIISIKPIAAPPSIKK